MYSSVQLGLKYIKYYIGSGNGKGHGTHSPFVYDFITNVLNNKNEYYCYGPIETLRGQLKRDHSVLEIEDFGAGSRLHKTYTRTISAIAKSSLKPQKYAQLFFRMVDHYQPSNILELGTSLGITTAYLAAANEKIPVTTMEGANAIAAVAVKNFEKLQLKNISVITGNFDETLPSTLQQNFSKIDFAFIDGNHRKEPTIKYFEQLLPVTHANSILIFDDIHWSKEMEEAWEYIKAHKAVTLSIDLFFIGIIFFRMEQKAKQDFIIRF